MHNSPSRPEMLHLPRMASPKFYCQQPSNDKQSDNPESYNEDELYTRDGIHWAVCLRSGPTG